MRKDKIVLAALLAVSLITLTSCNFDYLNKWNSSRGNQVVSGTPTAERSLINTADGSNGIRTMPSLGDVNILVVPVEISGFGDYYSSAKDYAGFEKQRWTLSSGLTTKVTFNVDWLDALQKAFFGDTIDTGYESVSSFYEKSSYGKLKISGVVSPVYETEMTYDEMDMIARTQGATAVTNRIMEGIYEKFFVEDKIYSVSDFDGDKDDVIDGIWMIYDIPDYSYLNYINSDLFWAYTSWYYDDNNAAPSDVHFSNYCWASKWFMTNGVYSEKPYTAGGTLLPDAHTYIHETGHLMGLNDYYDTSSNGYSPAGALIMMDHNVYDQDPYSKYLLGWIDPKHVKAADLNDVSSLDLTLEPFEDSGDALILDLPDNKGWVGEQYVILCYWTPTGLNETDSENSYMANAVGEDNPYSGLDEAGIMMFQIDSRFVTYRPLNGNWTASSYATEKEVINASDDSLTRAYTLACNNDTGSSGDAEFQLAVIDASKRFGNLEKTISWNGSALIQEAMDNDYLFHQGDTYDSSYYGKNGDFNFYFHSENFNSSNFMDPDLNTGLKVTFGEQNESGAKLTITKE